jgi:chemotaxis protein MotB
LVIRYSFPVSACLVLFVGACASPQATTRLDNRIDSLQTANVALTVERNLLADSLALLDYAVSGDFDRDLRRAENEVGKLTYDLHSCREGGEMVAQLLVDDIFAPASASLTRIGMALVDSVVAAMLTDDLRHIKVVGHADNSNPGGSLAERYPTNWELSAARASAIVRRMVDAGGIDPKRIAAVSHGSAHPEYSNGTADGRRRNRRIEFLRM